jgi:NACalpha-BTF3-like transcription factor
MIDETRVRHWMKVLGISQKPVPEAERVVIMMKDGSWIEFDGAQVQKLKMRGLSMFQIRGEPKRVIDFAGAFEAMFPEGCKYL